MDTATILQTTITSSVKSSALTTHALQVVAVTDDWEGQRCQAPCSLPHSEHYSKQPRGLTVACLRLGSSMPMLSATPSTSRMYVAISLTTANPCQMPPRVPVFRSSAVLQILASAATFVEAPMACNEAYVCLELNAVCRRLRTVRGRRGGVCYI